MSTHTGAHEQCTHAYYSTVRVRSRLRRVLLTLFTHPALRPAAR